MTYRPLPAFEPIPISPDASMTREGVRHASGRGVAIRVPDDLKPILPSMQARLTSAVSVLLPAPLPDGGEAWERVGAAIMIFARSADRQTASKAAADVRIYLTAANLVACNLDTEDEDILFLRAFCDTYLAVFGRSSPARHVARTMDADVAAVVDGSLPEYDEMPGRYEIPSLRTLGADVEPFGSVSDLLDYFQGTPDLSFGPDGIVAVLDSLEVQVDVMPDLEAALGQVTEKMVVEGVDQHGADIGDPSGNFRFRVERMGATAWTFRPMPKAPLPAPELPDVFRSAGL